MTTYPTVRLFTVTLSLLLAALGAGRAKEEAVEAKGIWKFQSDFSAAGFKRDWRVESEGASIQSEGRGLHVSFGAGAKTGGTTLWLKHDLPGDVLIDIDAETGPAGKFNACNLNVILNAREKNGVPMGSARSGAYRELHEIPNYIVTFTGGSQEGHTRIRRDPGFALASHSPIRSEPGRPYHLRILHRGASLRVWIDGQKVHDWTDPHPLANGSFALRTWQSDITFKSVTLSAPSAETLAP